MWARLGSTALGIWLMAAPAVLGYSGAAETSDRIAGPVIATFAIVAISEVTRPLRRVNTVAGVWLLLAPWLLGFPAAAAWNSVAVGVLVIGLSLVRGTVESRFGGGWRVLWTGYGERVGAGSPPPE
ncbi:MAG TPA: SPW repeat protein [Longimicrobiaceae bacterium]|nr:SPW repeat protein [Longimicrobiaceae bacterium]